MSTGKIEIFDQSGTDPIVIAPSSPRWAADAHKWMRAVSNVVSDSDHRVEHIGSTSVPGLAAKPVIDILVPVTHLAHEESYLPGIEGLGLILRAREADNRFFRPLLADRERCTCMSAKSAHHGSRRICASGTLSLPPRALLKSMRY
nr:GrpB family protein [Brevibacterium sp. 239c]